MAEASAASLPASARRKNTQLPSRKRVISPASAISFKCRLIRGWLCPRIWVRSLTFSSPPASSARMRKRVASPAARKPLRAWARDRLPAAGRFCRSSPDIKICLYVIGRRCKGRGLLQLTGLANYAEYGKALGVDLENNPAMAAEPALSLKIACEYWKRRKLNPDCDRDDIRATTRR